MSALVTEPYSASVSPTFRRISISTFPSRDASVSLNGTLAQICGQNPVQTRCYSGATNTSSLSFIRAYNPSAPAVSVKDVQLVNLNCNDASAPYFLLNGGCSVEMHAVVQFNGSGDQQGPSADCAQVSVSPGGAMTWSEGGIGGPLGTWKRTISLASSSGRTAFGITARYKNATRNDCQQLQSFTDPRVAAPYVANDASGPVEYLHVLNLNTGTPANSLEKSRRSPRVDS